MSDIPALPNEQIDQSEISLETGATNERQTVANTYGETPRPAVNSNTQASNDSKNVQSDVAESTVHTNDRESNLPSSINLNSIFLGRIDGDLSSPRIWGIFQQEALKA